MTFPYYINISCIFFWPIQIHSHDLEPCFGQAGERCDVFIVPMVGNEKVGRKPAVVCGFCPYPPGN